MKTIMTYKEEDNVFQDYIVVLEIASGFLIYRYDHKGSKARLIDLADVISVKKLTNK